MKLLIFVLAFTLAGKAFATHLETCECHEILKLVNETVEKAVAQLENKLCQVNSSVNEKIHSSVNNTNSQVIKIMETLVKPIQYQLNHHLPPPPPSKEDPVTSCKDVDKRYSNPVSGYYWIKQHGRPAVRVYCSMNSTCGGQTGIWMRVANIDMKNTSQSCPSGFRYTSSPKRSCSTTTHSQCVSNSLSTQGIQYSHVCGKIIGYQVHSPLAFVDSHIRSIDSYYVTGVSLTHSSNPRKHIWTFAGAVSESSGASSAYQCRCMRSTAPSVPSYVGNDYFCDTAEHTLNYPGSSGFYTGDPLWDGRGCGSASSCCSFNNPPWFVKELSSPTTDNIEMRVCRPYSGGYVAIETVELYVQ